MEGVYHDNENPQIDAVERYRLFPVEDSGNESVKMYHMSFLRSHIKSDVMFQLRIIMRGRRKDGEQDNGLELTDDLEYQFNRWIDTYISEAKKPLARYIVENAVSHVTNVVNENEDIEIKISVGDWWNSNVLNLLMRKIHDYIVNGVMYEYLSLYLGGSDSVTQSKEKNLLILLEEIKNLMLSYKAGSVQKQFHPFP